MTITTNKDLSTKLMKICGKFKLNVVKRTLNLNLNPDVVVVAEVAGVYVRCACVWGGAGDAADACVVYVSCII